MPDEHPDAPRLELVIESLLFVTPEPMEVPRLAQVLGAERGEVEAALSRLADDCRNRGVRLQRQADAVQFVTAPEAAPIVERLVSVQSRTKLSPAALETLAVVAYRQPVTRAQIEAIRGVNCERALATLQARGLIAEVGRQDKVGRPILFGTTVEFLEYFGLTSLADLPRLDGEDKAEPSA